MRFIKSLATIVFVESLLAGPQAYATGGDSKPIVDAATCKAVVKATNMDEPLDVVAILQGRSDQIV